MRLRGFNKKQPVHKDVSKLVIDTHGGLQDIFAIICAHKILEHQGGQKKIIGITCVGGKNSLEKAVKSAQAVNMILGTQIPIYRGQSETLLLKQQFPKSHLEQNFTALEQKIYNEVEKHPELEKLIQEEKASDFYIRISHEHKEKLCVVALGPHTNLGLAHRIEDCFNHIGMVGLNGGQYLGVGNTVNGMVEANYAHDPLASSILFEKRDKDLREILYTNPIQNTLSFNWKKIINSCLEFPPGESPYHPLVDEMMQTMLSINSIVLQNGPLLTLLPICEPKIVKNMFRTYGEIVRDGYSLDGLLALNWLKDGAKPGEYPDNVYVYADLDGEVIEKVVKEALLSAK